MHLCWTCWKSLILNEWLISASVQLLHAVCGWKILPSLKTSFTKAWLCHLKIYTNILPLLWKPLPAFLTLFVVTVALFLVIATLFPTIATLCITLWLCFFILNGLSHFRCYFKFTFFLSLRQKLASIYYTNTYFLLTSISVSIFLQH